MKILLVGGLAAASGVIGTNVAENVSGSVATADAARSGKVTICHRTNSVTNPYRMITVNQNSITRNRGHRDHDGQQNNQYGPFDPTFTYPNNAKNWGDIIPGGDADGLQFNGTNSIQLNWTAAGKSFLLADGANKALCRKMSAKEYYDRELAEITNPTQTDINNILEDLDDQGANEDKKLAEACGQPQNSLVGCDPATWNNLVKVETKDPTNVTKTTAKLNGEVTCGTDSSGAPVKYYFEWGTAADLSGATATSLAAVSASGQSVNVDITGLSNGTYYYRVICVTDHELETEGVLEGSIKTFAITDATPVSVPSSDTTAPASNTTAPATTAPAAAAKGKIVGVVWLELTKDGKLQTGEPLLGQYVVTLRLNGVVVATKTTGSKGEFEFADLAPGTYVVTVTLADGSPFVRSSDTDGSADWVVNAVVKANETASVEYAAVGAAKTGGKAVRIQGGSTTIIPKAKVTCTWAGLDGKLGTADDADFTTTAGKDGTYLIKGIPTGKYSCVAVDPVTKGKTTVDSVSVTAASAKKSDAAVKTALLKITGAGQTLPETGSNTAGMVWMIFALIASGFAAMSIAATRRGRRHDHV